jgi:hypothetical protein
MSEEHDIDEQWWLPRDKWPKAEGDFLLFYDQALALLICEEIVVPLAARTSGEESKSVPGLYVMCNDVFFWGCADAEPLPLLGFGDAQEEAFWDLYKKVRLKGFWGSVEWCCMRRGMRPQAPVMRDMKAAGYWNKHLESLPERDV